MDLNKKNHWNEIITIDLAWSQLYGYPAMSSLQVLKQTIYKNQSISIEEQGLNDQQKFIAGGLLLLLIGIFAIMLYKYYKLKSRERWLNC